MSSQQTQPSALQQRYLERRAFLEQRASSDVLGDAQEGDVAAFEQVFQAAAPLVAFIARARDRADALGAQQREEIALGEIKDAVIDYPGKPEFSIFIGRRVVRAIDAALADEFGRPSVPKLAPVPEHILPNFSQPHRLLMWNIFEPYQAIAEAEQITVNSVRSQASEILKTLGFKRMEAAAAVLSVQGNVDMSNVPQGRTECLTAEEIDMLRQCHKSAKDITGGKNKRIAKVYEKMEAAGRVQAILMAVKDGEITEQTLQAIGLIEAE